MTRTASNAVSPKKLLHTKWTAVVPRNREKHFIVTKVIEPEPPGAPVVSVEIEAPWARKWDEVYALIKQRWPTPAVSVDKQ